MIAIIIIAAWLIFGWAFTRWFVNHFLENRRFNDGQEIGPAMMLFLNLAGPLMAAVMIIVLVVDSIITHTGPAIKRFYGVKDAD